jgi:hypothetical protein
MVTEYFGEAVRFTVGLETIVATPFVGEQSCNEPPSAWRWVEKESEDIVDDAVEPPYDPSEDWFEESNDDFRKDIWDPYEE